MDRKVIMSVGIDVGTSTTQLIFSALHLVNRAGPTQVPRYEFTDRKILYQSPVAFTPKDHNDAINRSELAALVTGWFSQANVSPSEIETGAVIITGESLKATNAKESVMGLAEDLGDFVVATAGPHLESIIAGRGSGAATYSQENGKTVLNIDIGGGTANYVVFSLGHVVDTACLNVGGRLIQTDSTGRAETIHAPAKPVVEAVLGTGFSAPAGDELSKVTDKMADIIYKIAIGEPDSLGNLLLQTPPLQQGHQYDAVFISGGVGACCYEASQGEPFRFGDVGPLLAKSLLQHRGMQSLPLVQPECTVRATVIGAGAWSLSLSGSTVWAKSNDLPLKNIPVVIPAIDWSQDDPQLCEKLVEGAMRLDLDTSRDLFAVAIPGGFPVKYATVQYLCTQLEHFWNDLAFNGYPALVVVKEDVGKVLGMELNPTMKERALVVVDEVEVRDGDYIDLGKPLFEGGLVPMTIKSLAFPA